MIINSKNIVDNIKNNLINTVQNLHSAPKLAIVTDGKDRASEGYMQRKHKFGKEIGVEVETLNPFNSIDNEEEFASWVKQIQKHYDGIIIQLPLANVNNPFLAIENIDLHKDSDKFTTSAVGQLSQGNLKQLSATPKGILYLLYELLGNKEKIKGKDIIIVNRTNIIGKPLSLALMHLGATVTVCHSQTKDLKNKMKSADIVITAIGKPHYFDSSFVDKGQVIIDAGTTFVDGKQMGDFNTQEIEQAFGEEIIITAPTGCVGPLTVACLFETLIEDYTQNLKN